MSINPTVPSHLARARGERPEALAKHAMHLLEQRIYDEFGLKLCISAELEFTLVPQQGLNTDDPVNMADANTDEDYRPHPHDYVPAKDRPNDRRAAIKLRDADNQTYRHSIDAVTDPLFPDSPVVSYSYMEAPNNQLEAVIGHAGRQAHLPADGSRSLYVARAIAALRTTLETSNNPRRRFARDDEHDAILADLGTQWRAAFDSKLRPHAKVSRTQGLHINFSLVDADDNPLPKSLYQNKAFKHGCEAMANEAAHLLIAEPWGFARLTKDAAITHNYALKTKQDGDKKNGYFELRTPSASSDPYYAVMLALAGAYDCLKRGQFDPAQRAFTKPESAWDKGPSTPELPDHAKPEAYYPLRFFNGERQLLNLLNELEPRLGERFEAAVRTHPPLHSAPQAGTVRS